MSQRDIVIVPTYDRPEYLALCLERVLSAKGSGDVELWVCQDNHTGDDVNAHTSSVGNVLFVSRYNTDSCHIFKNFIRDPHSYYGNSYNILEGLKDAYETGADRVYLIEDDVMITEDFFLWHEEIQKQEPDAFVSIASNINMSLEYAINGPEVLATSHLADPMAYYASVHAYSSIGVCFNRDALHFIVPDFCNEETYNKLGPGVEQDILIKRQMKSVACKSVWPYLPRAHHMGWYGYHRNTGLKPNGTVEDKIKALRYAFYDQEKINSMALSQNIKALSGMQPDKWWEDPAAQFFQLRKFR